MYSNEQELRIFKRKDVNFFNLSYVKCNAHEDSKVKFSYETQEKFNNKKIKLFYIFSLCIII